MSKFSRGLVLGLSLVLLLVSVASAGPTRTDGDPDRPQIANPARAPGGQGGVGVSQAVKAPEAKSQPASDHWKFVLKAYLRLIRVFAL